MNDERDFVQLREEIARLLVDALALQEGHASEMHRRDELHLAETTRRDELHVGELHRRDDLHTHELETFREALETRDVIGQGKGVIMASLGCSADHAFQLLKRQSQHENRKIVEIAGEIAARASAGAHRGDA